MEAMQKFWVNEDLLEHLMPMMDLPSTLALASVNPLVVALLGRPLLWQHLLSKSWKLFPNSIDLMTDLLKMMEDPEPQLLDFLEYICQNYPLLGLIEIGEHKGEVMLHLGDNYKVVGPSCFMLMQYVVARMESKVMVVEEVHLEYTGGLVGRALASQASCQQQKVKSLSFGWGLELNEEGEASSWEKEDVTNCTSLLQNSSTWSVKGLYLQSFGESSWRGLAEASEKGEIVFVEVKREALILGRPADVRKVWLATRSYWRIIGLVDLVEKVGEEEEEEGWAKILEIMEMEDNEWKALSLIKWWY